MQNVRCHATAVRVSCPTKCSSRQLGWTRHDSYCTNTEGSERALVGCNMHIALDCFQFHAGSQSMLEAGLLVIQWLISVLCRMQHATSVTVLLRSHHEGHLQLPTQAVLGTLAWKCGYASKTSASPSFHLFELRWCGPHVFHNCVVPAATVRIVEQTNVATVGLRLCEWIADKNHLDWDRSTCWNACRFIMEARFTNDGVLPCSRNS